MIAPSRNLLLCNKGKTELNHSFSMLQAIVESTPYGLLVTNKHGHLLCYNQPYMDMWRIPPEVMVNARHQIIFGHYSSQLRDPQQFLHSTEVIYGTWLPESFDILEFLDGRAFERHTKATTLEGPNMVRVWSFKDITERRQAEAYKAQLAAMVESSDDAIIVKDLNAIITSWNAGAERIFGYQASEITGSSILALIPPERHEEEKGIMSLVKSGNRVDHFETMWWGKGKKPIDVSVTTSAVKDSDGNIVGISQIARDITKRKESQKRIEYLAHYDPLTGLPNRALLADRMKTAIENAKRYSFQLAVLFVDLDHFKLINDSLGHEIGDKLLKIVAERMRSRLRQTDTVSRLGGDEFIILLSRINAASDAACVAEKIIAALSQPYHLEQHELGLGASIGISIYPDSGKDTSSLLRSADEAMYSAKGQGRNRYHGP
ncbi:diguanylate cyclase with PAS/PAC sensor [Nitrosospira multiformis ATCC 25196]|uniref:Diguanylate cyclase with PAS/PAC sensor n=1 Tax=Nitrosospira multiformis (strain ATCC 25196 / NCIMB 11849 / C 71) TaxID=323848 RepID=Q2Y7D8_NITMU|nr:diguanylate cyclase with PAS/PAC sensor [Nitrosospira multiformis ATCC 25196]SEG12701.1 diguanylate cyclase with PAS/PAC sensor [Nitrosospira multiformis ATCC 25196]